MTPSDLKRLAQATLDDDHRKDCDKNAGGRYCTCHYDLHCLRAAPILARALLAAEARGGWITLTADEATMPTTHSILVNEWWYDSNRPSHRLMTPESLQLRWVEIHDHPAFTRLEWMPWPSPASAGAGGEGALVDRDALARVVREAWVKWARTQPNPKPSWLVPYDDLSEPDKEADRQIGEAVAARLRAALGKAGG